MAGLDAALAVALVTAVEIALHHVVFSQRPRLLSLSQVGTWQAGVGRPARRGRQIRQAGERVSGQRQSFWGLLRRDAGLIRATSLVLLPCILRFCVDCSYAPPPVL